METMGGVDGMLGVREAVPDSLREGNTSAGEPEPAARAIPPLAIGAFMVTKDALVGALWLYVPHLTDVEAIPGDRFLLYVGPEHPDGAEVR